MLPRRLGCAAVYESGRHIPVDVFHLVGKVAFGGVPAVVGSGILSAGVLPVLLAHAFFNDAAYLSERGASFDGDVKVSQALAVHEGKAFLGKRLALTADVFGFAVAGVVVVHSRWCFWLSVLLTCNGLKCYYQIPRASAYKHNKY